MTVCNLGTKQNSVGSLRRKSSLNKEEQMAPRILGSILKQKQDELEPSSVSKVFNMKA